MSQYKIREDREWSRKPKQTKCHADYANWKKQQWTKKLHLCITRAHKDSKKSIDEMFNNLLRLRREMEWFTFKD